MTQNTSI